MPWTCSPRFSPRFCLEYRTKLWSRLQFADFAEKTGQNRTSAALESWVYFSVVIECPFVCVEYSPGFFIQCAESSKLIPKFLGEVLVYLIRGKISKYGNTIEAFYPE